MRRQNQWETASLAMLLSLSALGQVGCSIATGGNNASGTIDFPKPFVRPGRLSFQWRRSIAEPAALEWNPKFNAGVFIDPTTDMVFAGSIDHGVYALSARDGTLEWRFEGLGRMDASPLVVGNALFIGSGDGAMYRLDAKTGAMRWRFATPAEINRPPVMASTSVIFTNAGNTVYAVSEGEGTLRWRYKREQPGGITLSGHAGVAVEGNRVFAGFSDGHVVCLDARDGSVLWDRDTSEDIENFDEINEAHQAIDVDTTPLVLNDMVYAASYTSGIYALDSLGGGQRWRVGEVTSIASLCTDGQYLYATSAVSGLVKIDPYDGSIVWARDMGTQGISSCAAMQGNLLVVSADDNGLWLVNRGDGSVLEGVSPGRGFSSSPAITGNRIYAISHGNVVYSLAVDARPRNNFLSGE